MRPPFVRERQQRIKSEADRLGLVARWARKKGYIGIHDPTTGEWHDVATNDAPDWARREAFKRKELRNLDGIKRLLTRAELEKLYEPESTMETPAVTSKGIEYRDYIEEEED